MLSACPSAAGVEVSLGADGWGWAPSTATLGMAKSGLELLDTSSLGEPLWANSAAPTAPVVNVGPAPPAAGSDHPLPWPCCPRQACG